MDTRLSVALPIASEDILIGMAERVTWDQIMTGWESNTLLLAFGGIGVQEMIVIGILGVLLFGKRLPEVGRSVGKTLAEFRSSLQGIQSEINSAVDSPSDSWSTTEKESDYDAASDDFDEVSVPKFEPPTSEPIEK